jgi:LysM domain
MNGTFRRAALCLTVIAVGVVAWAVPSQAATCPAGTETVKAGDSWSKIGDRLNVATGDLIRANGGSGVNDAPTIHPGDCVKLPGAKSGPSKPTTSTAPASTVAPVAEDRSGWTVTVTFPPADCPKGAKSSGCSGNKGTGVVTDAAGVVRYSFSAGRSVCDDDNDDGICSGDGDIAGYGSDAVTPLGTFRIACRTEVTADGKSCGGWLASSGLKWASRIKNVGLMSHYYRGVDNVGTGSHGCIRILSMEAAKGSWGYGTLIVQESKP